MRRDQRLPDRLAEILLVLCVLVIVLGVALGSDHFFPLQVIAFSLCILAYFDLLERWGHTKIRPSAFRPNSARSPPAL